MTRIHKISPICGLIGAILLLLIVMTASAVGQVVREDDPALRDIDIVEHPGDTIPFDVAVVTDRGDSVTIGSFFTEGRPVMLIMAYYTCPMLCNLILNGVTSAAGQMDLNPGTDYKIVTVSIDPTETADLAAAKKKNYIANFGKPGAADGWAFCVAEEAESRRLADAIGFKYYYDENREEYAHAAVVTILTGSGVISKYLYGIEYLPRDMKFSIIEASEGKVGTTLDRILLYCYHYDPDAGGYTLLAFNVMKLGGALTLIVLGVFLGVLWLRDLRRKAAAGDAAPS